MPPVQCYIDGCEFETPDMGEALAAVVLSHHLSTEHAPQAPGSRSRVEMKKPDRPIVKEDSTDQDWAIFEFEWGRYCKAVGITAKEDVLRSELLNCCDPALRQRLLEMVGPETLNTTTEEDLKAQIKEIAVLSVDPVVHRVQFSGLKQDQGESFQRYVPKLKAKASLCKFVVTGKYKCSEACTKDIDKELSVSYRDDMVESQMVAGLYNPEHRTRVMQEADKLKSFDDKFRALAMMHSTEMSTSKLDSSSAMGRSAYKNAGKDNGKKCKCGNPIIGGNIETCRECWKKNNPVKTCGCGNKHRRKGDSCWACSKRKKPATTETKEPEEGTSGMSSSTFTGHAVETTDPTSEWQKVTRRRSRRRATRAGRINPSSEAKTERTMQRQYARGLKHEFSTNAKAELAC